MASKESTSSSSKSNYDEKVKGKARKVGLCEFLLREAMIQREEIEDKEDTGDQEYNKSEQTPNMRCKSDYDEDHVAIFMAFREFGPDLLNPDVGITKQSLHKLIEELNEDIDQKTIQEWMDEYDKDFNGIIDINEFVQLMLDKIMEINDTQEEVTSAFKVFDRDSSGFISVHDLRHIMSFLGDPLSDEEINLFLKKSDLDGDGMVKYEEFTRLMFETYDENKIETSTK